MSNYPVEYRTLEAVLFSSLLFGLVYTVPLPANPSSSSVNVVDPHKTLEVDFVDDNHSPDFNDADYGLEMLNDDSSDPTQKNKIWMNSRISERQLTPGYNSEFLVWSNP
ncbi:unnamed protein product [Allacma fusca]|uniref:Uncharacterized protein n=1 Tax=Allacma fusca TaxID=39272 RepID=A0A8J2LSY7_9HEXA|nr:unnamed protein product [Allacma fusca]